LFQPSTRLLISQTLVALHPSRIHVGNLSVLRNCLSLELSYFRTHVTAYLADLTATRQSSLASLLRSLSLEHVENGLSLLDAFLLGQCSGDESAQGKGALDLDRADDFAGNLLALCVASEIIIGDSRQRHRHEAGKSGI
jgi:hypothetical protein